MLRRDGLHSTIHWDPRRRRVVLAWKDFACDEAFRRVMSEALDVFVGQRGATWLTDATRLGVVTVRDQEWLRDAWFPRALSTSLQRMAVVTPHTPLARMGVHRRLERATADAAPLELSWFESVDFAAGWLDDTDATQRSPIAAAA